MRTTENEYRKKLVLKAINRIIDARDAWLKVERNPVTTASDRALLRDKFQRVELEFSWQWENVKEILGHYEHNSANVAGPGARTKRQEHAI